MKKRVTSRLRIGAVTPTLLAALFLMLSSVVHADMFYASLITANVIEKFDSTGVDEGPFASGLNDPTGLVFDTLGNLYVAERGSNAIEKFNSTGIDQGTFVNTGLSLPEALALDSTGNLYVASFGNNSIVKITSTGVETVFASLSGVYGLAFDNFGNLYASSYDGNLIEKFSPTGMDLGTFVKQSDGLNGPAGLAFDSLGNLYVANSTNNSILKFNSLGMGGIFGYTQANNATGLAFDSSAHLYATGGSKIFKYDSSGGDTVFATTSNALPWFLATQAAPVPERSTLALGIIGAMLLFAIRRLQ